MAKFVILETFQFFQATKTELKTKMSSRLGGIAISKSATTSSISDNLSLNSLSRKFSDSSRTSGNNCLYIIM